MESTLPPFLHIKADNLKKEYENSPVNYEKFIEYDEAAYESTRTSLHAQLEKWYEIHKNVYNEIYIISKSKSLDEYYINILKYKYTILDKINEEIGLIIININLLTINNCMNSTLFS